LLKYQNDSNDNNQVEKERNLVSKNNKKSLKSELHLDNNYNFEIQVKSISKTPYFKNKESS
ncbi:3111_t:CDS:1, partial [Cetraspora pellucida]